MILWHRTQLSQPHARNGKISRHTAINRVGGGSDAFFSKRRRLAEHLFGKRIFRAFKSLMEARHIPFLF